MRKDAPFRTLRLPKRWKRPVATRALSLLGVCFCGLASADFRPPAPAAETYTSEYEKAPHPSFVVRERAAAWAQTEQDRYRVRVHLPDTTTPEEEESSLEVQAESSQSSHASRAGLRGG